MMEHLLPSNATPLEEEMARQSGRIDEIDESVIATIWDAWACPPAVLPWLAWALSVDIWDDDWDEITKRQAIADSPAYHRLKGTRAAVDAALARAGVPTTLTEWWEATPRRRRGTARVHAASEDYASIPALFVRLRRLVYAAKPKSRAVAIAAGPAVRGVFRLGGGVILEEAIRIQPYALPNQSVRGAIVIGAGLLIEETIRVNPS